MSFALGVGASGQPLDYDVFSEPDGYITEDQETAALDLLRDPVRLELLHADVLKGNTRALHVFEQLEATLLESGRRLAERVTSPDCLIPSYRELSKRCVPDWSFLDFLARDKPGAAALRQAISRAFAVTAHQRGLENRLILSALSSIVSVGVAATVLREAEATAAAGTSVEELSGAAGGPARVNKVGPHPEAQGSHTSFKRDPTTGKVTGYTELDSAGNPVKRFRGEGKPHGGVEPPFVLEPKPGKGPGSPPKVPRTPRPDELPKGYGVE
ncbi:MAG TPA: polymorphic toxin type 24 domain-containing protein [Myxococcaceae bacterium]|nr:polymorphic toxin type 24 domain-containing protein [Myxococcaceae bacterium]